MKKLLYALSLLLVSYLALVVYIAHDLSAPSRRPVMPYHQSWLLSPADHGIQITSRTHEGLPYLIVEAAGVAPAKRGSLLRDQVKNRDLPLTTFGTHHQHLVLYHGRKGRKEDLLPIAERYAAIGYRCLVPDMPGHGDHPSQRSYFGTSDSHLQTLISMIESEERTMNFPTRAVLWGMSMGGSFACQSVAHSPDTFSAVIIVNSFDTLSHVVDHKCASYGLGPLLSTPVKLCSRWIYRFDLSLADSVECMTNASLPLLVAHGTEDKLIPLPLGRRLYESSTARHKQWISVEEAHHTNVLVTAHPLHADTAEFLIRSQ